MSGPDARLAHSLKPRHVTMISLGGIIGAGLFVGSSSAIGAAGPSVLITYCLCGALVFLIMRMLGEMTVAKPGYGSFAEYSGLGLGRWAAFVTGWLYWYFWIYTVGVETVAGAHQLADAGLNAPSWLIGLVLVSVMTATNLLSVRAYAELEFWFALLKVTAIACFILLGFAFIVGFGPGVPAAASTMLDHGGFLAKGTEGLMASIPIVIFSMMGSEVATIAAAESADPARNVARAARSVALRIVIFYVFSILIIVATVQWDTLLPGHSPFPLVLDKMHIPGGEMMMRVIVITAVLSCLNSGLYVTSRMLYELAVSGDAPAVLASTNKNKVPTIGILIGCGAGYLAALAEIFLPDEVFSILVATSGDIILFIYMIIALAQIRLRRQLEAEGAALPLKMWLFPWLSYAVVGGTMGVLIIMAFLPDQRQTLIMSALSVVFVFAALGVKNWRSGRLAVAGGL